MSPASLGSVSPGPSSTTTFTAGAAAGSGSVIASVGAVQGSASVSVSSAGASNSPTNLSAVPATGKGVQLSWTAPSSAVSSYRLYRRTGVSGSFGLVSSINGATTYKDTTTTRGVTYYYYATAVNSAGESAPSNTAGPVVAK